MIHALYLSLWYPNRKDAMSGLFVRKHAIAASKYCNITVLLLIPDEKATEIEIINQKTENINEVYVYVPDIKKGWYKSIYKLFYFLLGYHLGFNNVLKFYGKPDIVQSHILTRTGFMAWFIKLRHRVPYILFEHWSRFLPYNKTYNNKIHEKVTQFIVKQAEAVLTVSEILRAGMQSNGLDHKFYYRVNNVVDDFFFEKQNNKVKNKDITFLNITCFDERSKNLSGLIRTASKLADKYQNFRLVLVGTGIDFEKIRTYAQKFENLNEKIEFTGELTPIEVKSQIDRCDCVTQFSNFETAGIVVAEAMACGKFIISTSVGIAPEYINENSGVLIAPGDEDTLLNEMINFIESKIEHTNTHSMELAYKEFSFENVGKQLYQIYKNHIR